MQRRNRVLPLHLCKGASLLPFLLLGPSAFAGTYAYNPGTWGSLTGSGSSDSTAYIEDASPTGIAPSLTETSPASGDAYTLGGTYSFSVVWTPAGSGDTAPPSVVVTFNKQATLSAFGTGVATVLSGSTTLLEMDSSNNLPAGNTSYISAVTVTIPLVAQSNGTYLANGTVTTDTLSTTYNSGTGGVTSCQEIFTLSDLEAGS